MESTYLTHGWESEYKCVRGFQSCGLCEVQLLFWHLPLPDMSHPLTHEVFLECIKVTVDPQGPILSKIIFFTPDSRLLLYLNFPPKKLFQKLKTRTSYPQKHKFLK